MAKSRLLFPALAAVALGLSAASLAHADPVADAKDLFTRGRELRTHGDCAGAVPLFRKASELYPAGLGSVRNLAECEEHLGHYASARRAWLDLKRALLTTDDKKYDGWSQDAEAAAARLAPKLATLTIDVSYVTADGQAALSKGASVTLDSETLPPALVGTPLERDPGHHVVRVAGDRVQDVQQKTVDLVAGDNKHVALRVVMKAEPHAVDVSTQPAGPDPGAPLHPGEDESVENARSAKRLAAWIAIGVGGASLIGAGISLAVRQSALSDAQTQCGGNADLTNCPPANKGNIDSDESRGHTASTMVTVLGIVGVVGLTSGIVLLATSHGHAQQSRLIITPTLGGASAAWRF